MAMHRIEIESLMSAELDTPEGKRLDMRVTLVENTGRFGTRWRIAPPAEFEPATCRFPLMRP